ncbi:hypothetical protein IscW_ISCW020409 [Ixodes scapularis]|uniref:Uncharacterized protein n=1 Tax=Ixodes scapularis TaxID=6945 RepID=B7PZA5_IXOSC|nr:hypothetical protein IscW_ISCW020409 [Ixodes scapularis]|eukprot:XP_002405042.1 hypothetical protein IscW_ISCW020409 [Ixodes scapularis]
MKCPTQNVTEIWNGWNRKSSTDRLFRGTISTLLSNKKHRGASISYQRRSSPALLVQDNQKKNPCYEDGVNFNTECAFVYISDVE